jgi:hypothetical protein
MCGYYRPNGRPDDTAAVRRMPLCNRPRCREVRRAPANGGARFHSVAPAGACWHRIPIPGAAPGNSGIAPGYCLAPLQGAWLRVLNINERRIRRKSFPSRTLSAPAARRWRSSHAAAPLLAGCSGFAEIGQGQFFGFKGILQRNALLIPDSAQDGCLAVLSQAELDFSLFKTAIFFNVYVRLAFLYPGPMFR